MKKHGLWMAAVASLVLAGGASAGNVDDGWLAWMGCWRTIGAPDAQLLCIVPDGAGVKLLGIENGAVKNETRLIADNTARPASQEGCSGTERALWSKDHTRVFLHADQTCGEQTKRTVTGLLAMVKVNEMVSVQSVTAYSNTTTRSVRYQLVETPTNAPAEVTRALAINRLARETARFVAGAKIDFEDVTEAVANVHPEVVQGWLAAAEQKFDLNGKKLVALSQAGVPSGVLDVMVAVSHPQYFALKPATDDVSGASRVSDDRDRDRDYDRRYGRSSCYGSRYMDPWLDPFAYSFYGYGADRCRSSYGLYGYSPMGFYSPYYNNNGYRYGTPVIVVRQGPEDNDGKVTRNGYSRGKSSNTGSSTTGSTVSRPSTGSSSTGSASSGSSSSGSSTTRTAKPRGGN